jgi:hypothetical protein
MTSCDRPKPSHRLRLLPWSAGLCRLLPAPAGSRPFPTLSPRVFPWMPGPLSRRCAGCTYPFLPPHRRPSPSYHRSALPQIPTLATSEWKEISQLQPFLYVRASKFACHPDRSHLCEFHPQGGRGVYVRAEHTSLPVYASDMLALRIGQLRARGLSPRKTHGLVGRSDWNFLSPNLKLPRSLSSEPPPCRLTNLLESFVPRTDSTDHKNLEIRTPSHQVGQSPIRPFRTYPSRPRTGPIPIRSEVSEHLFRAPLSVAV